MNNLIDIIRKNSDLFTNYLLKQREDVTISKADSRIVSTLKWLLTHQNDNGSWGNDNVSATSLVIISFSNLLKPASGWELENTIKKSIELASTFLIKKYEENNYEKAVWDTAIVVRALLISSTNKKHFITARINWLLNINYNTLNAGPHHWAQRTIALLESGAQKSLIKESINQIAELLERGNFNYSPYVLSQCLEVFILSDTDYDYSKLTNSLLTFIKKTNLDSANFINICACLNSLYPILNSEIEKSIRISVASLFGETCFRENGTWYHDELATAWALIALTRFSKEVVIKVPKSEIIYESRKMIDAILKHTYKTDRENIKINLFHVFNLSFAFSLITFFITYTSIQKGMYDWLQWCIPSIFMALSSYSWHYFYRIIKEAKNDIGH